MVFKKNFPAFLLAFIFFINIKAFADSPADSSLNKDSPDVPIEGETKSSDLLNLTDFSAQDFEEQKSEVPESVKSASQAVWFIASETEKKGSGTGFFIGPNRFVTNFHVVEAFIEKNSAGEKYLRDDIYLSQENMDKIKVERVLAVSFYPDLAILETKSSSPHWLKLRESAISPEEKMFIAGYPKGKFYIMENTGPVKMTKNGLTFFVNHFGLEGASGGPVLDSSAHVAGVLQTTYPGTNLSVSFSTEDLKTFIEKNEQAGCKEPALTKCLEIAFQEIQDKAENNLKAQYELHRIYWVGLGVERDEERLIYWLKKSAEAGFAESQYELSLLYELGKIVPQDAEKSFDLMKKSAEAGFVLAQYDVAGMYWYGQIIPQDKEQVVYWLEEAAKQNYALAQYRLYWLYWEGEAVPQDKERAVYWLKKAAKQNYALAQYRLYWLYWNGEAVPQDKEQAVYWLDKAAEGGLPTAQHKSAEMYLNGEISLEDEESFYWLRRSAEQRFSSPEVWYELSLRYWEGRGVEKNVLLAIYWMESATLVDYLPAKDKLEEMYKIWTEGF